MTSGNPGTPTGNVPGASGTNQDIRRVAILFAGGPAPAANAVISTCAVSFLDRDVEVLGVLHGYSNLVQFSDTRPMEAGSDYIVIDHKTLKRTRNSQGILIGTARTNPGEFISSPSDLTDPEKSAPLKTVYDALCSLEVDALVSIGGDDTLKTANKLKMYQDHLPEGSRRIPVVHVPKTIDNDYMGIDFTFGYFTATDTLATEIRNLLADAEAAQSYFIAETMGRSAGWLAYGAAIAGEASLVISVEDITGDLRGEEPETDPSTGETRMRPVMKVEKVVEWIVKMMRVREEKNNKRFGVIVLAEGLAELMPDEVIKDVPRDSHGHIAVAYVDLGKRLAKLVAKEYEQQTGKKRKITGVQLGYEARCAKPHAYDVMLGSQLGVGAFRALYEERKDGIMVSVHGQLALHYVPFDELVDPKTLVTVVRYVKPGSDFHRLARFLETQLTE